MKAKSNFLRKLRSFFAGVLAAGWHEITAALLGADIAVSYLIAALHLQPVLLPIPVPVTADRRR